MLLIRKKLFPMIRENLKVFLGLTFVAMIGIGIFSTAGGIYTLLSEAFDSYITDYNYPDALITYNYTSEAAVTEALSDVEHIEEIDYRSVQDASIRRADGRIIVGRFLSHSDDDKLSLYTLEQMKTGQMAGNEIAVFPNYRFAKNNNLSLEDQMTVLLPNGEKEVILEKFVSTPECIFIVRNQFLIFDNTDFGYFYLRDANFTRLFDMPAGTTNQASLYIEEDADHEEVLAQAVDRLKEIGVQESYVYEDSLVKKGIDNSEKPIRIFSNWLPPIYMVAMLIFLYLSVVQLVKENRIQIGVLQALGFHMRQIIVLFSVFVFCSIGIASIFGMIIGYWLTKLVVGIFADVLVLPSIESGINIGLILFMILLVFVVVESAVLIACRNIAKIKPADAMRNISPTNAEPPFLVQTVFSRMAEIRKILLSEVLRNKGRFLLSVVCITLAATIIFIGGSFWISQKYTLHNMFEQRFLYDAQIYFKDAVSDAELDEIKQMKGVTSYEKIAVLESTLEFDGEQEVVLLNGLHTDSELIQIYNTDFQKIPIPKEGIVLEEELTKRLGIEVGESVTINGTKVLVMDISNQNMMFTQYCSMEQMEEIAGTGRVENGVICTLSSVEDEISLNQKLSTYENFYSTMFKRLEYDNFKQNLKIQEVAVYLLILSAVLIGFTIIYNMALINLSERKRMYSILLVNGFSVGRIRRNVLLEVCIQFILAMGITLTGAVWVSKRVLTKITTDISVYPYANSPMINLAFVAMMFLVVIVSNLIVIYRLRRLDLSVCLKERE